MRNPVHSITKRLVRLRRFPILVRRRDTAFLLDPTDRIDTRVAAGIPYEPKQFARAADLIAEHRLDVLVDVGANLGLYTVLLGRRPDIARVYSFEPARRKFNQLLGNVFANRLDRKVDAFRVALGDRAGAADLHIDPRSTGISRFHGADRAPTHADFSIDETVELARFDDLVQLAGARVFLKIDVEGHAETALAGMERLLTENHVVAQIEVFTGELTAVQRRMAAAGYREIDTLGEDRYYAREDA